ncbi:MAG: lipid-A-disaccharide synthase [Blastocatellia bacterium]
MRNAESAQSSETEQASSAFNSALRTPHSALRLMLVAGEASGDKHGAHLVEALRALQPQAEFELFGAGGDEMRAAGVETLVDARDVAIMGVLEVAAAMRKFLRAFRTLRDAARERKPDAVILIDWPEFNLRLAKRLHRDGQRVVYYISPQVWAWRSYRVRQIRRDVERMLVILPFEKDYYAGRGVQVEYVGHPLLDSVRVTATRAEFCEKHGFDSSKPLVALLPGSRRKELACILPPMIAAARQLHSSRPDIQFVLPLAPTITRAEAEQAIAASGGAASVRIIENDTYNAVAAATLAVVASGTATLETAIIGTPLIVVYKASQLNWRLFRPLINVPFVGMPNLIAGREIAPELLQDQLSADNLAAQITSLLNDNERLMQARADLATVRARLGEANASQRAAQAILDLLSEKSER